MTNVLSEVNVKGVKQDTAHTLLLNYNKSDDFLYGISWSAVIMFFSAAVGQKCKLFLNKNQI